MNCPHCNSVHTVRCGFKLLANGGRRQRWQCMACGHYFMSDLQSETNSKSSTNGAHLGDFI